MSELEVNTDRRKISGIYKITNPNGRVYIGKSINIHKRWMKYKI